MRGNPQNLEFIYKHCIFILTCLNFSHLQSTLHLMQYTYQDIFSPDQNSFELDYFDAFYYFWRFLFHLFHIGKTFPLEDIFRLEKQTNKKIAQGKIGWTGVMPFFIKNCWTFSEVWAGVLVTHPSWNGQTRWKTLQ